MLSTFSDEPLSKASFKKNATQDENAWLNRVDSVKRVFESGQDINSSHEYLDLSIGAILERFPFLNNQLTITDAIKEKLVKLIPDDGKPGDGNYNLIQALFQEIQDLNRDIASLTRSISALAGYASSKGYTLITKPGQKVKITVQGEGDTTDDFKVGELVQSYQFITRWSEEKKIQRSRRRLFRSTKRWTETIRVQRSAVDIGFKIVNSADSLVSDYIREELAGYDAIVLKNVEEGFEAIDGRSLNNIMSQCELDTKFQAKCALLMPVYNQTLFGDDVIVCLLYTSPSPRDS